MQKHDSLRRRPWSREPLLRFLLVCEGKVTEKSYFIDLRRYHQTPVQMEFIVGAVPKTLVERAVERKKEADAAAVREKDGYLRFDEVWVVCDVDEHPRLGEALQQARANCINVALSNPCFELWALLHFQEQARHIDRHAVQSLCRKYMPSYQKKLPYSILANHYSEARERAVRLIEWHSRRGTRGANPTTNVHELVELIRNTRRETHPTSA